MTTKPVDATAKPSDSSVTDSPTVAEETPQPDRRAAEAAELREIVMAEPDA